jgi:hypothetical protein
MLKISIKSLNPKGHIEAASFIMGFGSYVLENLIYNFGDYYGYFLVEANEDFYEVISEYSSDILVEIDPKN